MKKFKESNYIRAIVLIDQGSDRSGEYLSGIKERRNLDWEASLSANEVDTDSRECIRDWEVGFHMGTNIQEWDGKDWCRGW